MGKNSKIPWCDNTFNPWIGCTKVSPGCENCYAEAMDKRFGWTAEGWGKGKPRKRTSTANWKKPLKWNGEAERTGTTPRVFCGSLCDILDHEVDYLWRIDLFKLTISTPNLEWLLLTKRIGALKTELYWPDNIRLGITICNQEEADRDIPKLLELGVPNFLSIEPMLGQVLLDNGESSYQTCNGNNISGMSDDHHCCESYDTHGFHFHGIDWVIVGGESGPNARPMHPDWARSIRDQCANAGVPFFFKAMSGRAPIPEDLMIREFPE